MSVPVYPMYERQPRVQRGIVLRRMVLALVRTLLTWLILVALILACCAESVIATLALGALAAVAYGLRLLLERRA